MRFEEAVFCSVDLETTGVDVSKDEILAFACIPVKSAKIIVREACYLMVKPDRFRIESMKYHGISEEDLRKAPSFEAVRQQILSVLNGILIGYSARFDYQFLQKHFKRNGVKFTRDVLDIALIESILAQGSNRQPDLTFEGMMKEYGLEEYFRHNALSDAFFAAQIFQMQLDRLSHAGIRSTGELIRAEKECFRGPADFAF